MRLQSPMHRDLSTDRPKHNEITFVTYNDSQSGRNHDLQTRQLVRKQARKASQRPKKSSVARDSTSTRSLKESQSRFRLQKNWSLVPYVQEQDGIETLLSPFTPTIQSLGDDAVTLMNYYCYVFQSKCVAINFESDWLAFVLSNTATAHALLALVSLSYDAQAQGSYCGLNAKHNGAAIALIRQQLSNSSTVSDTMLCAIALLTVAESIQDKEFSSKAHFQGLEEMIRIRGGSYDVFSHCRTLQKIMSWARRIYCLRSNQPFGLPAVPSKGRAPFDCFDTEAADQAAVDVKSISRRDYSNAVSRELDELVGTLHVLSSFPPEQARTSIHRREISYIIYDTEYRLILLNQRHLADLSGLSSNCATLSRSFQLAVQIYVMAALRRLQPTSALVQRYASALRREAGRRQVPRSDLDSASLRSWTLLLLWIETVLAAVTIDSADKLRSISLLRTLLGLVDCMSFDEYIKLLKEVSWLDDYLEDQVEDLWLKAMQRIEEAGT